MRICSLLPSATEIVCALGLDDALVGISHECDFPPSVTAKPALIRPRVNPAAPAAEIDRQARELIGRGESIYSVDADLLLRLARVLILTQDLCHVCAASRDVLATALGRAPRPPRVLTLSPHSLGDVWNDIRAVGEATGRRQQAKEVVRNLEARLARVERSACRGEFTSPSPPRFEKSARGGESTSPSPRRPRVVCLEWLSPLYVGGHWVPEMVALAGGEDALGRVGEPSFRVSWQQVLEALPDVVLISPCGYGVEKAAREFRELALPDGWADLPAVHAGRVFAVNANSYFSRPGPRLADGIEILAGLLWPKSPMAMSPALSLEANSAAIPRTAN